MSAENPFKHKTVPPEKAGPLSADEITAAGNNLDLRDPLSLQKQYAHGNIESGAAHLSDEELAAGLATLSERLKGTDELETDINQAWYAYRYEQKQRELGRKGILPDSVSKEIFAEKEALRKA